MDKSLFSRRAFITSALVALSGCGENRIGSNLKTAFQFATVGLPGPTITRAMVDSIPYASIAARIGNGPRSLLVLWDETHEGHLWLSADGVGITTRGGRIVKTVGLERNLRHTSIRGNDPVGRLAHERETTTRLLDLEPGGPYELPVASRFEVVRSERITITEIEFETIFLIEECKAQTLNWSFTNRYWVDPADGFVWRSEQHIYPTLPVFEIDVLKPPSV